MVRSCRGLGRLCFLFVQLFAWAVSADPLASTNLRDELHRLSAEAHKQTLDYKVARKAIVGSLHAAQSPDGKYFVRDVYCQKDMKLSSPTGMASGLNVEHTWPQSHFFQSPDMFRMKSDLHHLFPTRPSVNTARGNLKFGVVDETSESLSCTASRLGIGDDGEERFEPPNAHKGNVARALFYFAVRYGGHIDQDEEAVLRVWHKQDPVDAAEMQRNEEIEKLQGNRNPFIDHPEYVELISDF
jgi:hypothetical protein